MAQNIIYSPWERTKGPWLCLMTTLLLFSLLWLFSFVSAFFISLIKPILWLKFSTGKRQAENLLGAGKDHTVLLCFKRTPFFSLFWPLERNCLSFFHEIISSKCPLSITCIFRSQMYSDSIYGWTSLYEKCAWYVLFVCWDITGLKRGWPFCYL